MHDLLRILLVPLCLIIAIPVLLVIGMLVTSPMFWILVGIGIVVFIIFLYSNQKSKGYLSAVTGYVSCVDVDSSKISAVYLYPDKITVNDIQTIPIERVEKAFTNLYDQSFVHRGYKIKRDRYNITICYKTKEGASSSLSCVTKDNPISGGGPFEQMKNQINKLVGYVEPSHKNPSEPYEL